MSKLKTIRFTVDGRRAFLDSMYYSQEVKDVLSFSNPGAFFHPAYKQWIRTSNEYKLDPKHAPAPSGWNGKTSLMKNGEIGIGLLKEYKPKFEKAGFRVKIRKWRHKPSIELRRGFWQSDSKYQYQNDCVHEMLNAIPKFGGGLVLAATGAGKTSIAAMLASHIKGNILFVVDQVPLFYQSQKEIKMWLRNNGFKDKVGIVGNSKFDPGVVTIATVQTLQKFRNNPRLRELFRNIDIVIIDEIHKQMGRRNFNILRSIRPDAVFGLTATLQMRKKQVALKAMDIAGPTIFKFPIKQGVALGVLSQGVVVQICMDENINPPGSKVIRSMLNRRTGKFENKVDNYLHEVVYHKKLNKHITSLVEAALDKNYATAVLVERIKHVKRMKKNLADYDPRLYYGAVSSNDRRKNTIHFEKGTANLIIANTVFTKGINIKRLDMVIDDAQRQSKDDCMQKFGRAVRLHHNKKGAIYFSIVTMPAMKKAADSQRSAFKAAKVPFERIEWSNAEDALCTARKLLNKTLKGNKK